MKIAVRCSLSLAIAGAMAFSSAQAGTLTPGQSATVQPGDAPERWTLSNAELIVNPGGRALEIVANPQSQLTITGAEVAGIGFTAAISLQASALTLSNSTVINNTGRGMTLATGNTLAGSTATVSNSQITGLGLGISVFANPTGRSTLTLDRTQVLGRRTVPPYHR